MYLLVNIEREIDSLKTKLAIEAQKYETTIQELEMKLGALTEFMNKKDEYTQSMSVLEAKLIEEQNISKLRIDELEMKIIMQRKANEEKMEKEVTAIREEYHSKVDRRLDEKTREIMLENIKMKEELKIQEKESHAVLGLNSNIIERDRDLRNEYELSRSAEKQLQNKLGIYQVTFQSYFFSDPAII